MVYSNRLKKKQAEILVCLDLGLDNGAILIILDLRDD
jgi:hypothetical protein